MRSVVTACLHFLSYYLDKTRIETNHVERRNREECETREEKEERERRGSCSATQLVSTPPQRLLNSIPIISTHSNSHNYSTTFSLTPPNIEPSPYLLPQTQSHE